VHHHDREEGERSGNHDGMVVGDLLVVNSIFLLLVF
jgi:hypothetical protein